MIRKAGSWWVKLSLCLVAGIVICVGAEKTKGEWLLATDVQKYYRCLPFDWYLVTHLNQKFEPQMGELVQFKPPGEVKRFTNQFEIIKIVAGVAGDRWRIEKNKLYINGELWGDLHLLRSLELKDGVLDGEGVVPDRHVYVLGTNPSSYDSRYWGPLDMSRITGKAYAIL